MKLVKGERSTFERLENIEFHKSQVWQLLYFFLNEDTMVRRVSFGELSKEQRLRKNTRKMKPTKSSISILPLASSSGDANDQKTDRSVNYRIRIIVLLFLCLQNSGHALVARYSQV